MLIDTHCHLTDENVSEKDVVEKMRENDIEKVITVAYDLSSSKECIEIAARNENVYATVGIHPSDSCRLTSDPIDELRSLLTCDKVVALGEIGLDYHFDDDKATQKKWFDRQLDLLKDVDLPVSFHIRDAYEDTFDVVKLHKADIKNGGVLHCYSGSYEYAKQYLDMGFYVSFSGTITFKNSVKAPEIIKKLPLDRILIETDSPYLTPVPFRGTLNTPLYVKYQAMKIAEILGKTYEEIRDITTENAYSLFTKMKR